MENNNMYDVLVLGAGISGLATAYKLKEAGFKVLVLEADAEPGGSAKTVSEKGYIFDTGPNSALDTSPLIGELASSLGIEDKMIYPDSRSAVRYILKDNKLTALPGGPMSFIDTKLFSLKAKLRVIAEPFIRKGTGGYGESISEFVVRRLGREFLDYAVNPFVAGVYAGDPDRLSVKSALPKLYALEEKYGSIIKGAVKGAKERKKSGETAKNSARMFSFTEGMSLIIKALQDKLEDGILLNTPARSVKREGGIFTLEAGPDDRRLRVSARSVINTIPAYSAAAALKDMAPGLGDALTGIYYPPVVVLFISFKKTQIKRDLNAFGFLIPKIENKKFLGAIWSSTLFPGRCPEDEAAFTIFVGGARQPEIANSFCDKSLKEVLDDFKSIMNIEGDPSYINFKNQERTIPQYNIGYRKAELMAMETEKNNPGLFIRGNFIGGIAFGDCIKNSEKTFQTVKSFLQKTGDK